MIIKKGDIWFVDLEPVKGQEYEKKRPVVIVSTDLVNKIPIFKLRIVVPLLTYKPKKHDSLLSWLIKINKTSINGLTNDSVADPFQIRCVSEERFDTNIGKIGKIKTSQIEEIENKLIQVLDIDI